MLGVYTFRSVLLRYLRLGSATCQQEMGSYTTKEVVSAKTTAARKNDLLKARSIIQTELFLLVRREEAIILATTISTSQLCRLQR
mmetsp:Transcript_13415/g.19218  ORF Transcript_13415/g.19218 Transcript_13415/m.19218 type:complete len:85 (+) Transcript_13415:424-678(+)